MFLSEIFGIHANVFIDKYFQLMKNMTDFDSKQHNYSRYKF